jgi:hypothetical protein
MAEDEKGDNLSRARSSSAVGIDGGADCLIHRDPCRVFAEKLVDEFVLTSLGSENVHSVPVAFTG